MVNMWAFGFVTWMVVLVSKFVHCRSHNEVKLIGGSRNSFNYSESCVEFGCCVGWHHNLLDWAYNYFCSKAPHLNFPLRGLSCGDKSERCTRLIWDAESQSVSCKRTCRWGYCSCTTKRWRFLQKFCLQGKTWVGIVSLSARCCRWRFGVCFLLQAFLVVALRGEQCVCGVAHFQT